MPSPSLTDPDFKAVAEAVYTSANVESLRDKHRLSDTTSTEAMQSFLIAAGTVYLTQKFDQAQHQAPSLLNTELKAIHKLAGNLLERLAKFPAHVHDFQRSRLMQQLPFGGLGPSSSDIITKIEMRHEPGSTEHQLSRQLNVVCSDNNRSAVEGIMVTAGAAAVTMSNREFSGRLSDLALNRWADNVRNFWTKGMQLPFAHSVEGPFATSEPANFCIDAMAMLDTEPTKSEIMTAVRYARDAGLAWQREMSSGQAETPP
jgi:hypothetical protein